MKLVSFKPFKNSPDLKYTMYGYTYGTDVVYWSMRFYTETWQIPMSLSLLPKKML